MYDLRTLHHNRISIEHTLLICTLRCVIHIVYNSLIESLSIKPISIRSGDSLSLSFLEQLPVFQFKQILFNNTNGLTRKTNVFLI